MTIDLRLGKWQDALAGVECDALIADPPYSRRTHAGQHENREGLDFAHLSPIQVRDFVASWSPRVRGWMCVMCSHDMIPGYESALRLTGRYVFHPIPIVCRYIVRLQGDGPGSGVVYMLVSRPRGREYIGSGSRPALYQRREGDTDAPMRGGKPLQVMRQIVRDYSAPGDLVCDPFAGSGTTLLAAALEGRRAIGAEVDAGTAGIAADRIADFEAQAAAV